MSRSISDPRFFGPAPQFWSWATFKQPVNQWLCIALISLMCVWTLLYYFTHKAEALGTTYFADVPASSIGSYK